MDDRPVRQWTIDLTVRVTEPEPPAASEATDQETIEPERVPPPVR